ncbi:MAG: hypothetical protein ACRDOL_36655 [Streptosporangiaceae bacterium]
MAPPDPFDAALSAVHDAVDNLGPWLAIWEARTEPDAHARRCASDAIDAIDAALLGLHSIRAEPVTQVRRADDQSAARADELLARLRDARDGPVVTSAPARLHHPESSPLPSHREGSAERIVARAGDNPEARR